MAWDDQFWDNLLLDIEDGLVVPVVGRDVLKVHYQDQEVLLYPLLAQKLAAILQVSGDDLPEGGEINAVVGRYLEEHDRRQFERIYRRLPRVMDDLALSIPEPLAKLAAIRHFKLFVTTTFDSLLERAISEARNEPPQAISYSLRADLDKADLPCPVEQLPGLVVFHLFGKVSASEVYAVTQEDTLEFLRALQSESRRPHLLIDELSNKDVLLMGCGFGGWLARFFLRATKRNRLLQAGGTNYLADTRVTQNKNLVLFLRRFSPGTEIYEGNVSDFIDELHRRWIERYGAEEPETPATPATSSASRVSREEEPRVFLSYASEDRDTAKKFIDALRKKGIDVFFDRDDLRGGDDWSWKLKSSINKSWLFIPLVSKNTMTPESREFREEWVTAEEQARRANPSLAFAVPVVIDGTPTGATGLIEYKIFRDKQWIECRQGEPTEPFVTQIRDHYRKHLKARTE